MKDQKARIWHSVPLAMMASLGVFIVLLFPTQVDLTCTHMHIHDEGQQLVLVFWPLAPGLQITFVGLMTRVQIKY